jgi:hypothetical protein
MKDLRKLRTFDLGGLIPIAVIIALAVFTALP